MAHPPTIKDSVGEGRPPGVFKPKSDPAKYTIERARFQRPSLWVPPNGKRFEWPGGLEGVSISGQPGLAEHRYLGDNAPVVQIVHRDARRIELSGVFPGLTGGENVRDLLDVMTAVVPRGFWILTLPYGLFTKQQQVVVENYNFTRTEEERTDGFAYTVTFVRTGVGGKVNKPKSTRSPVNPVGGKKKPKGKTRRVFTTKNGGNTLRAVAQLVYRNPNRWREIYNKNTKVLKTFNVPLHQLQYKRLPYGMKLNY